jgi:hypothetical protein
MDDEAGQAGSVKKSHFKVVGICNRIQEEQMKARAAILLIAVSAVFVVGLSVAWAAGGERGFPIYDNMYYKGKPDTSMNGLVASNILYENKIWPNKQEVGTLPDRKAFESLVRKFIANPGPLVIDIESLPLKGSPEAARKNMETLAKLADWAREAAPGKMIGYYGTNTLSKVPPANLSLARELATHVDAFFPPMYTFDDDRTVYEKRAKEAVAEAHDLASGKLVYFYLWPQYHDGTPKAFQYVDASYWKFQLETARRHSDGIVLWSPSRYEWSDETGWWAATVQFIRTYRGDGDPVPH